MEEFCCSQFPLYRDLHSTRSARLGEPPPVSLLSWSRGGLVKGHVAMGLSPCHVAMRFSPFHAAMHSYPCHIAMCSSPLQAEMHSSPCHLAMCSSPCHLAMRSLLCHAAMPSLFCHSAMRSLFCHVAMRSVYCHAAMHSSPGQVDDEGGGNGRQGVEQEQARPTPLQHPHSVLGGVAHSLVNGGNVVQQHSLAVQHYLSE